MGSKSRSQGGKKASELGVQSESFGDLGEVFREGHLRVGRLGGAQRSPEVPCMVYFQHQMGTKTEPGQCIINAGCLGVGLARLVTMTTRNQTPNGSV